MTDTVDRPLADIVMMIARAITDGKIKGQMARDLEKLSVYALKGEHAELKETIEKL